METQPYILEKTFDAPVSNVWKAITQPKLVKQWFFDMPDFKAEVGHEFSFESQSCDEGKIHLCKVTEVIKDKRLAYTWRYKGYEGNSLVTFEIFDEGKNQTRLRLTHKGLETFPRDMIMKKNISGGWDYLIGTTLKNLLENPVQ